MSTPDTNNIGIKLQAAGENLNTWGDPNLNNDLIIASNLASKWNVLTVNVGGYTVSETNYSTTNDTEVAFIKLNAGTIAAAFNFVMVGRAKRVLVWNNTGYTATLKLAATTGFSLPTGRIALVATDGSTDVYNASPSYIGTANTISNAGDVANKSYVDTAIATAVIPAAAGTVLNSGSDTTAGYLGTKATAKTNGGLVRSTLNAGANEQNQFALDNTNLAASTNVAAADTLAIYDSTVTAMKSQTRALLVGKFGLVSQASSATQAVTAGNLYPLDCTAGAGTLTLPAAASAGDVFAVVIFGTNGWTMNTNSLNYYGAAYAAFAGSAEGLTFFYYSGASRGWIDA